VCAAACLACGSGPNGETSTESRAADAPAAATTSATQEGFDRQSFVLCEAFEPHREELASIVGFEQDADRSLSVLRSECVVRGEDGAFARVSLLPAIVRSVAMQVGSYDGEATPAPELGDDAMFVEGTTGQPHVIFAMGPLFIDVDAENIETPSRETMIELAVRVREILTEANS